EDRRRAGGHEEERADEASSREPADAADAVAAGAAAAEPGSEADEDPADGDEEQAAGSGLRQRFGLHEAQRQPARDESQKEDPLPDPFLPFLPEHSLQDAAHAGRLAREEEQTAGREADEGAARQGLSDGSPIHGRYYANRNPSRLAFQISNLGVGCGHDYSDGRHQRILSLRRLAGDRSERNHPGDRLPR